MKRLAAVYLSFNLLALGAGPAFAADTEPEQPPLEQPPLEQPPLELPKLAPLKVGADEPGANPFEKSVNAYEAWKNGEATDPKLAQTLKEREGKVMGPDGKLVEPPKDLPPYAAAAMAKGLTPVIGPDGSILGFDDAVGQQCALTDAVQTAFGANLPQNPEAGATAAGALAVAAAGAPGGTPPPVPHDFIGPLLPGQERLPAPGEVAKEDPPKTPDDKAKALDNQIASASESGDRAGLIEALNGRNENDADMETHNPPDDGDVASFGPKGADVASTGPGANPISGGGAGSQGIGASGQVGGFGSSGQGGGLQGKRVRADAAQEADALLAFQDGVKRGLTPPDGPSNSDARSIARAAQLAANNEASGNFSGAMRWAQGLSQRLGFNIGADVEAQGALDDQLGTNPIDGGGAARASIQVVECRNDTLGGTAGGRTSRRVGGC